MVGQGTAAQFRAKDQSIMQELCLEIGDVAECNIMVKTASRDPQVVLPQLPHFVTFQGNTCIPGGIGTSGVAFGYSLSQNDFVKDSLNSSLCVLGLL